MWSKPILYRFQQPGKVPQTQASQGFAAFRLTLSRIQPRHSQTRRDTNFAIPGYSLFCHDTTASGKNKDFSVCGHSCGQSCFCAAFGNRWKSRKRRRRKAFRRFTLPRPGCSHGTPKSALQRFRPLLSAAAQTWVSLNRSGINDCRITTRCCPEVRSPIAPVVLWV